MAKIWLVTALLLWYGVQAPAQSYRVAGSTLERFFNEKKQAFRLRKEMYVFYQNRGFAPAWVQRNSSRPALEAFIRTSDTLGLQPADYPLPLIPPGATAEDSLMTELKTTEAVIHFCKDLYRGNVKPILAYNGFNYGDNMDSVPVLLARSVETDSLITFIQSLQPRLPAYRWLLSAWKKTAGPEDGWKEMINGIVLTDDQRKRAIDAAISTVSWLQPAITGYPLCLVVNIPSATLHVYAAGELILESRIIVGKPATPTGTLCSKISTVVLYPYWTVPQKIAVYEMLPAIKRNKAYLDKNHFNVYDHNGRLVNPEHINWQQLGPHYFPYTIRQSTGCDNSLGIVKFDFDSPFGIYLHDTPGKALFNLPRRYYSHGCVRVEKTLPIARLLLKGQEAKVDSLKQDRYMPGEEPQYLPVPQPVPLFILYNMAWFNQKGQVQFYPDIYHLQKW